MCKRRSNQAVVFGQNDGFGDRQRRCAVRNVHENRPVHGDVNTALGVNESRHEHLFDGYLMADPKLGRQTSAATAQDAGNQSGGLFDGYLME